MAFLDNSGDIILDAVLTDTGRMRMAKGDGSFKIVKFALGDDEIDYSLYNKDHSSGSAYYDLEILQTPILEAFTDTSDGGGGYIRSDQGLDTSEISAASPLGPLQMEAQYVIEIDNRFGQICTKAGDLQSYSFVDDDNIAYYNLSWGTSDVVSKIVSTTTTNQVIAGPRGTKAVFKVQAAPELNTSNYFFTTLGSTITLADADSSTTSYYSIDSTIRITGLTTGYRMDVPVRFVKRV